MNAGANASWHTRSTPTADLSGVTHRFVDSNGIRMHIAEAGAPAAGEAPRPIVLLCHGFPESWYSWRHQLAPLAAAGYHVVAPSQRGYGQTDAPPDVRSYTQLHLVGDMVGLLDALGCDQAACVVGHDWGGPVAWNCALLRPDRFASVVGVSVKFNGVSQGGARPTEMLRSAVGPDGFFYVLYFQEEGLAETELDADLRATLRSVLYSLSGDIPRSDFRFWNTAAKRWADCLRVPAELPPWLSEHDLDVFTAEFAHHGTFRGGINWYRGIDLTAELMAPFAGQKIHQPALFVGAEHDVVFGTDPASVEAMRVDVTDLRGAVWFDGCGHWIQQERPAEFNEALLGFLGGL